MNLSFLISSVVLVIVSGENDDQGFLWEKGDYFQGDMVIPESQIVNGQVVNRNGLPIMMGNQWPGNVMFYSFHSNLTETEKSDIEAAFAEIKEATDDCITFTEASSTDETFVNITNQPNGCYASVGYGFGPRTLNLQNPGCTSRGTIMHETLHALGFFHMQSDPTRDTHVIIQWDNVQEGKEHNFDKMNHLTSFDVPYDLKSIMHYSGYAFAKDNTKPTIVAINDPTMVLGGRVLTDSDIKKLKIMYDCV